MVDSGGRIISFLYDSSKTINFFQFWKNCITGYYFLMLAKLFGLLTVENRATSPAVLDADRLRKLCLDAGADDVGFVELERPAIDNQRQDILAAFPATKTLISFVCRMNRENVRTPARSIANLEFHANYDHTNDVARSIVKTLEEIGVRAMNPSAAFPMEMERFPGKVWVVSHKPVAVAAGLGHMGIHRNVIHPKFGNFILLGTILLDTQVSTYTHHWCQLKAQTLNLPSF
jgi:epoxyqueuosine reductase QueG